MDDLYFIEAGQGGPIKIGRSRDVAKRVKGIRVGSPWGAEIVAVVSGRGADEPLWHRAFDHCRMSGEWFTWCPELDQAIKAKQRKVARQFK
jgi:hypothetical protein